MKLQLLTSTKFGHGLHKHMYVLLLACMFSFSFAGCQKENITLPASIEALMKQTNCTCEPFIDAYTWRNKIVYIQSCRGPACLCGVQYYNEEGEVIAMPQDYTFERFQREAKFEKNIWNCKPD